MRERRAPWRLLAALHRRRGEATQVLLRAALHELQLLEDSRHGCRQQQLRLQQQCAARTQQQVQLSAAPCMCIASWLDGERHREELEHQLHGAEQALARAQGACEAQQEQVAAVRARLARHTRQAEQYQARADRLERQRAEQRELAEDEEVAEIAMARALAGARARRA